MTDAKTFHGWSIAWDETAHGEQRVTLTKPGCGPIISWSRKGTDPEITLDQAKQAALAEDVRLAPGDDAEAWQQRHDAQAAKLRQGRRLRGLMAADAVELAAVGAEEE